MLLRKALTTLTLLLVSLALAAGTLANAGSGKSWALYSWLDDAGHWNYSLVRGSDKHPDGGEVKDAATTSLEKIKTRLSLLERGSSIEINPLPILNMELHAPTGDTIKEFERVCKNSQLTLLK
jgi:hypothetical protein